jgi:hypothetical protein
MPRRYILKRSAAVRATISCGSGPSSSETIGFLDGWASMRACRSPATPQAECVCLASHAVLRYPTEFRNS